VKAVLDTNTLVSGLIWHGKPEVILEKAISQDIQLYASEQILQEYFRIIEKLAKNGPREINQWKMFLLDTLHIIEPNEKINACRDPKDNMFLECAVECNAKLIVSGDDDLLVLNPYRGIEILNATSFVKKYS